MLPFLPPEGDQDFHTLLTSPLFLDTGTFFSTKLTDKKLRQILIFLHPGGDHHFHPRMSLICDIVPY